ncbi:hypothetical protein CEQ21_02400 [Niallia circulans]|uniref:Uncharacterized protein n=1 Tax=Niallia circulans TaxID=1397 RepID=A0A553SS60_NIACI|nr:hypothetical protein [Niallia circulans]TRZ39816.1 hypothetical protein CEQ21_02400 [Niallia circulans]
MKIQMVLILGFFFMLLYGVYAGGYSTALIFKYSFMIGMLFWLVDLFIEMYLYLIKKNAQKED